MTIAVSNINRVNAGLGTRPLPASTDKKRINAENFAVLLDNSDVQAPPLSTIPTPSSLLLSYRLPLLTCNAASHRYRSTAVALLTTPSLSSPPIYKILNTSCLLETPEARASHQAPNRRAINNAPHQRNHLPIKPNKGIRQAVSHRHPRSTQQNPFISQNSHSCRNIAIVLRH